MTIRRLCLPACEGYGDIVDGRIEGNASLGIQAVSRTFGAQLHFNMYVYLYIMLYIGLHSKAQYVFR